MVASRSSDSPDIDDLVQMTLLRAYLGLGGFRHEASFTTWLARIAINVCTTYGRRQRIGAGGPTLSLSSDETLEGLVHCQADQDDRAWIQELREIIEKAMEALPPRYQDVIRRFHFEDHTFERICRDLSIPLGTLKTWLHRGRLQLGQSPSHDLLG